MDSLPNRNDKIYKDVEKFADYELTQCVAFEMAIRNDKVIKLVNKLTNHFNNDDYYELTSYGLNYHELVDFGYLNKYYFLNNPKEKPIKQVEKIDISKLNEFSSFNKDNKTSITLKDNIEFTQEMVKGKYSHIENVVDYEVYKSEVTIHYSRPKLIVDNIKTMQINFDMNLPKADIEAQFKHILNNYYKDTGVVKTSLELLGDSVKNSSEKLSNKSLADKFFVYDYIKSLLNNIELDNNKLRKQNLEDIETLKNNIYSTGSDKKIQTRELKIELQGNLNLTTLTEILKSIEIFNATGLNEASIKRYYFTMKQYIEQSKYKELLTSI